MIYGYARVSAKAQLKGNSLEEQRAELLRNGCNVIIEEQFTGKTTARPKFDDLIKNRIQKGDTLIVWYNIFKVMLKNYYRLNEKTV